MRVEVYPAPTGGLSCLACKQNVLAAWLELDLKRPGTPLIDICPGCWPAFRHLLMRALLESEV